MKAPAKAGAFSVSGSGKDPVSVYPGWPHVKPRVAPASMPVVDWRQFRGNAEGAETQHGASYEQRGKTLAEWLFDEPELLAELHKLHQERSEWQGIDPNSSDVFYRSRVEVQRIRNKKGESGGHHPHGLALGGPEGQKLTHTGERGAGYKKNPDHSAATALQTKVIRVIKKKPGVVP